MDYEIEVKNKIGRNKKDISKYERLLDSLLEDYELDYIDKEQYEMYKNDYLCELNSLKIREDSITKKEVLGIDYEWIKNYKKNRSISKVIRNIVNEFIEDIIVDDNRNIKIIFKYKDKFEEAIKFLKTHNSVI